MEPFGKAIILVSRLGGLGLFVYVMKPLESVISDLIQLSYVRGHTLGSGIWSVVGILVSSLPTLVLLALALHLMLGGRWLLRHLLRGLDGTCPACGHPWPDSGAVRCPECGFGVMATRPRQEAERAGARDPADKVS